MHGLLLSPAVAVALAPGDFDPSFVTGDNVLPQLGADASPFSRVRWLAALSDGKLVLAGQASDATGHDALLVGRVNTDSSRDPSFATGGKLIAQLGAGALPVSGVLAVAVACREGHGKLVLAGATRGTRTVTPRCCSRA